jgi:hypothetical protein
VRRLVATVTLVATLVSVGAAAAADNVFVATANLSDGRSSHVLERLLDGRVLAAGGWGPIGGGYVTIKSSAELYDPVSGTWARTGDMTRPRANAVYSMLADGRVVIAGGESLSPQGGTELSRTVEIYSPASGTFTAAGELPFLPGFAQALANGRVLMVAGSDAVLYDPASGSSTATGHLLRDHQGGSRTLLADGRVLFAGGTNALDVAEVYDPASGTFARVGNMVVDRTHHTATLLADGRVLIVGGTGGYLTNGFNREQASVEVFDPVAGTFAALPALPQARVMHDATLLTDGTVLLTGGHFFSGGGPRSDAEVYHPATGSSSGQLQMHAERNGDTAVGLADGSVLVAGGPSPETAERFYRHFQDTTAPTITVPGAITTVAGSPAGAEVGYTATVVDDSDPNPTFGCAPASGSVFPIGTSTVTCNATDAAGNTAQAGFAVTVLPPLEITLKLDPAGQIKRRDGTVTVNGTATCNRDTHMFLSGEVTQPLPPKPARGFFWAEADCTNRKANWTATLVPVEGSLKPGPAKAAVSSGACDNYGSCANAQASRTILLLSG